MGQKRPVPQGKSRTVAGWPAISNARRAMPRSRQVFRRRQNPLRCLSKYRCACSASYFLENSSSESVIGERLTLVQVAEPSLISCPAARRVEFLALSWLEASAPRDEGDQPKSQRE